MKLNEPLVTHIHYKGRKYRLKTDFRDVLTLFDVLADESLTPEARISIAADTIFKKPPKDISDKVGAITEAKKVLIHQKDDSEHERITDFAQDADLIRSAFRQAYGIDLYRERLHWTEFTELLNGLPEGTRYTNILEIRTKPLPEATKYNSSQRQALLMAKMKYGIEKPKEETDRQFRRGVNSMANSLLKLAQKGSEKIV